jgi:hypothetical protein
MAVIVRDLIPAFLDFWVDPKRPWDAYIGQHPEVLNDLVRSGRTLDSERRNKAFAGYADAEARIRANAPHARPWIENAADRVGTLLGVADADISAVAMVGLFTSNGWVHDDTLYLAVEMIADPRFGEVLAAHEIAHVLQTRLAEEPWPEEGPLGVQVFGEGFATAVTAELYPQFGLADHLWFEPGHDDWLARCESQRHEAETAILVDIASEDDRVIASFLMMRGETALPRRVGYFVGTGLVQRLQRDHTWQEMARWSPDRALREIESELTQQLEQTAQ